MTLTASLDGGGNLVIQDTTGAVNSLTLQLNVAADSVVITDANGQFANSAISGAARSNSNNTMTVPLTSITGSSISIQADGGDDALTIDLTNGNFAKAITYDGGTQTTTDSLTVTGGGTFATVTHTATSASAGTIAITGNSTISYLGLEPVIDNLSATDRVFTFTGGAETITLVDAAGANMTIDSTLSESITFANPTNSLTINAGTGADTVTITSVDADGPFNASLTINGDAGDDTINLNADINFAANKNLDVNLTNDASGGDLDQISVGTNANLIALGTGTLNLQASRNIVMTTGSSLVGVNGAITVAGNSNGAAAAVAGNFIGVDLDGATLTTSGTGAISVTGQGVDDATSGSHFGIRMQNSARVESTATGATAGTITLTGTGGTGTTLNEGVRLLTTSVITAVDGAIVLQGTGSAAATTTTNRGILINNSSTVSSTGTGANAATITMTGTGGAGTSSNFGIHLANSALVTSVRGAIALTGTTLATNTGGGVEGVVLSAGGKVTSTGTGATAATITLTGTGGGDGSVAFQGLGIQLTGSGSAVTSVDGAI